RLRILGDLTAEPFAEDAAALEAIKPDLRVYRRRSSGPLPEPGSPAAGSLALRYQVEADLGEIVRSSVPPPELVARGLAGARRAADDLSIRGRARERLDVLAFEAGVELDPSEILGGPAPIGGPSATEAVFLGELDRIHHRPNGALTIVSAVRTEDGRAVAAL